jgi:hypothetical protein
MGPEQAQRRAITRALARRRGAAVVERVWYGVYRVASNSRPGAWHTVSVDPDGRYRCDCEAAVARRACWHQALIFVLKTEAGGGRVTGPAAGDPDADRELVLDELGAAA